MGFLFGKRPPSIEQVRKRRAEIEAKREQADADVARLHDLEVSGLIEDRDVSGIADERRKAEDDAKAALNALARLDAEIAAAEEKERIAADRKVREATSRHLHALADRLEKQSKAFLDAIPRFARRWTRSRGSGPQR